MGHYLLNFVLTTIGMVALLYLAYLYVKQTMHIGGINGNFSGKGSGLRVESVLNLEPRKRLYVVGCGTQRFLVATTMDKTELLATLEPGADTQSAVATEMTEPCCSVVSASAPLDTTAGFMDRFRYSLKMVLSNRFTQSGGK